MLIGLDLGGTKTEIIALDDAQGGAERLRRRWPTPQDDYDAAVKTIAEQVNAAQQELGLRDADLPVIGIGGPGAVSHRTGLMKNCNSTWMNGRPMVADLETALGKRVVYANDANCLAVSEAADGAGAEAESVFAIIIGTGCGGGLVVRGQVITGLNSIAGEWGHNALMWMTQEEKGSNPCYCGQYDCVETWLSGPGFARDYERRNGVTLTAKEIVDRAAAGDEEADLALALYENRFARALAGVINIIDPHVIVLGGGMSNIDRLYTNIPPLIQNWTFSDGVEVNLRRAKHGDSSGVRGAAWLPKASAGWGG